MALGLIVKLSLIAAIISALLVIIYEHKKMETGMKIIEGDYAGKKGRVIKAAFGGHIIEVRSGVIGTTKYKLLKDVETIKLLNKDESRTVGQYILILLLAFTLIGLILAIPLFFIWKKVDFTVGIKAKDGKKFVAQGNSKDWIVLKKYVGMGSLDSF